jgi:hypothetical protein
MDGLCDAGCGEPAIVEIDIGGESGFFCGRCAPTGAARPVPGRPLYSQTCAACGAVSLYQGIDDQGEDCWRCPECDHWQ